MQHGRGLGRVVGLVVDGDHLVAGADGEQHLGVRRRQRHDALRHVAGRRRCRRRRGRAGAGRRRRRRSRAGAGRRVGAAAASVAAGRRRRRRTPRRAGRGRRATPAQRGPAWPRVSSIELEDKNPAASPRTALASRVWLSHAGPGDRTRPTAVEDGGFTVAGQCRDLTGLRWVLRPDANASGRDSVRTLRRRVSDRRDRPTRRPRTRDPTGCVGRRRSWSSTPATARARARPRSA